MTKTTTLLFAALLFFNAQLKSQTIQDFDENINIEQAEYLKGNLKKLLVKDLVYPIQAMQNNIQGDVVMSVVIDKTGKLDSLIVVMSPSQLLTNTSMVAINKIENEWSPCKVNGNSVDKTYLMVFSYRIWQDETPPGYVSRAKKFVEKQKYEKALKYYNMAIKENQYHSALFESRSKVEEILGDSISAKEDALRAFRLKNEILSVVNIAGYGVTRVEKSIRIEPRGVY